MVKMAAYYLSGTSFRVMPIVTSLTVMDTEVSTCMIQILCENAVLKFCMSMSSFFQVSMQK